MTRGLLAALLLVGCASADAGLAALPAEPIAFLYRTVEETQRISDEVAARTKAAREDPDNRLELDLDRIADSRSREERMAELRGRLALYVAPERRLELPEALPRGASPLDWSPERRLMFTWKRHDGYHLFEWDPRSGEIRQLTTGPDAQIGGCYGPAGVIAFVQTERLRGREGSRIWVRRPGEAPQPVSEGPLDTQPSCTPAGERIVFVAGDGDASQLRWVEPRGGAAGVYGPGRNPSFSPDGAWLVYSARTTAGWRLRRMRLDGSGKRALGAGGWEESSPTVSPDGRFVVFVGSKADSPIGRLFVRSIDGAADRQLEFSGSGLLPVW